MHTYTEELLRYQSSITFSGFLNGLDGVVSGEERIVFMTTNHAENLDPALVRPGRVDLAALIDNAVPEQAKALFLHFYKDSTKDDGELEALGQEVESIMQSGMEEGLVASMAALQGLFIQSSAEEAVSGCSALLNEIKQSKA